MKVWTIANQKGGVGKTTTAVSLGGLLAAWGFRTLLVDIDPHGSLTSYFRYDPDALEVSTYSLFQAVGVLLRISSTNEPNVLPSSLVIRSCSEKSILLHVMRSPNGVSLTQSLSTAKIFRKGRPQATRKSMRLSPPVLNDSKFCKTLMRANVRQFRATHLSLLLFMNNSAHVTHKQ